MSQLNVERNGNSDWAGIAQQALHEINQTILESADVKIMMDQILEKTLEMGGFEIGMIRLFNPLSNSLEPVASRGYRDPANIERQRKRAEDPTSPRVTALVMERQQTRVENLAQVDGMRTFKREGVHTIVTVPLRTHEEILGVIHLGHRVSREVAPEQIRVFEAIGTQTGIAVQKIRLFEKVEQHAKQQESLNVIAAATSRSLRRDELLKIALEKVLEVTGRERVSIRLKDPATGQVALVAHEGFSPQEIEDLRCRARHTATEQVLASGQPLVVNNRRTVGDTESLLPQSFSVAWIPMKAGAQIVGVLGISAGTPRPFAQSEVEFLQSIGTVLGAALENARLFSQTERNLEQIRALHEIATAITSTLNLQETLNVLLEKIDHVLPYSATTVRLLDGDSGILQPVACRNIDTAEWASESRRGGRGLPYQVVARKAPLIVSDVQNDPRVRDAHFFRTHGLVSYLGVPLVVRGQIFGVLSFYTRRECEFGPQQFQFLTALASQAAVAIHNSQLHEQTRMQAAELERSNRSKDELLATLARQKEELFDLNSGLQREIAERSRARAEIAAKNRDLETLLYVTSHDLREPLRAIENFSRIVNDRYRVHLDEKGQDYLRRVILGAQRLNRLLDDILMLSRSQRIAPPTVEVDVRSIVEEAVKRLEEKIKTTGARVQIGEGFRGVRVDRTWVTQAVYNLIVNALKFTRDGEPPDVEIAPYQPEGSSPDLVGISVRDRGPGVSAEHAERIFQLFQRAVGREVEGTGAGLAIVRQIAERHGGSAWVKPREGGGSDFIITFSSATETEGGRNP